MADISDANDQSRKQDGGDVEGQECESMTAEQLIEFWQRKEEEFREELAEQRQMQIAEMDSDGNCLFRAVAFQVYGE